MEAVKSSNWNVSDIRFKGIYIGQRKHTRAVEINKKMFYSEIIETESDGSCSVTTKEINCEGNKIGVGGNTCHTASLKEAKEKVLKYINKKTGGNFNE